MLPGQCFCGDFGALGFRKTAFHGPAVAFFQNTLLQSRQPEKPPQRKTNHSEKSFKTLQQAAKLCRRQDGSRLQISCNVEKQRRRRAISSTSRLLSPARDAYGCRRQKAPNYIFG